VFKLPQWNLEEEKPAPSIYDLYRHEPDYGTWKLFSSE
jgi:hypothetical protein